MSRYRISLMGRIVGGILGISALAVVLAIWVSAPDMFRWWESLIFVSVGLLSVYVAITGASPKFVEDDIKIFSEEEKE